MTSEQKLVGDALEEYFEKYNLGKDGGLDKPWGKVKVGKFYFPIPNPNSRKRALICHDIHHLVTGYNAEWQGEASIAAWEVGSGCNDFYAAWVLDLGLMALGIWIFPKQVFKGFVRGMRSKNLYQYVLKPNEAKKMTIANLRSCLSIPVTGYENPTNTEKLQFVKWWIISWIFSFVFFLLPLPLIGLAVWKILF